MPGMYGGEESGEDIGAEDLADALGIDVGAVRHAVMNASARKAQATRGYYPGQPQPRIMLPKPPASTSASAGQQGVATKRVPLGLGSNTFTFGGSTVHTFEVEPQRDYQAERLVIDSETNASATGAIVTSIKVGDIEQMPSGEGMPITAFAHDAVDAYLDLSVCKGGTKLSVEVQLTGTALASGETFNVDCGFFGRVVGQ
jgi:hypothetical protein